MDEICEGRIVLDEYDNGLGAVTFDRHTRYAERYIRLICPGTSILGVRTYVNPCTEISTSLYSIET